MMTLVKQTVFLFTLFPGFLLYYSSAKRSLLGSRAKEEGDFTVQSTYYYSKHTVLQQSPTVYCIVYMNSVSKGELVVVVNTCAVKEYSITIHTNPTPSGPPLACRQ
jgi:hypothetical protein